jgi:hypothetical protein
MSATTAEAFDYVRILATTRTTGALLREVMDHGAALSTQYEAAIEEMGTALAEIVASECGCEDCSRDLLGLARDIATAEAERARLTIAFDVLAELSPDLPAAEPETIEKLCTEAQQRAQEVES